MKRCLSLLLFVLVLAVPAAANAKTYGAVVGGEFVDQGRGDVSASQVLSSLKALYAAGGRVARADSDWAITEPHAPVHGRAVYLWGYDDMIVSELAQAHLRWQPTLEFPPKWAQAHRSDLLKLSTGTVRTPLPPANNATFATYATAFMRRYGAHGTFWAASPSVPYLPINTVEVWNEPDNTHTWGPQIDLQDYARLYEAVRTAVHRVNRGTEVMSGGLAWTHSSLPRLLKAFEGKPLDAVAIHPYAATPATTIALTRYAIGLMHTYHRGHTPLIVNEYGWTWSRHSWGTTKARNVRPYVYAALVGLSKLPIAEIVPFSWADRTFGLTGGTFARAVSAATHGRG
jgi:hypothetical protein